jgi:aminopeptidase N
MPADNLTREEAQIRSELVSNVEYDVYLDITNSILKGAENETFLSQTTVTFDFKIEPNFTKSTFIDLKARDVRSIVLNGNPLDVSHFSDHRIELPSSALQQKNVLEVIADCEFTNTGEGLHRYYAEDEDQVYLYSQFEVADTRRMYAVFEQPDLKAFYTFTVRAPKGWVVTSTELENSKDVDGEAQVWHFGKTPKISPYLTSLCAGPFEVWETTHQNKDGRVIPMRVLARKSLAQFVDDDVIFDITKKGFDYYADLFKVPYMYNKYDQVFMPQFNAGAMENVGNVTYREDYIFNVKVSDALRERRVITILHELAHMWFGNYVTMKWWGDLWLNESFAEYVSVQATAEAMGVSKIWVQFNVHEKTWGLTQDKKPTTHPIAADIKDLNDVLVNFDGITYAKGAATLQALTNYCGRENFFNGISNYLNKFGYANATIDDLLSELSAASGKNLHEWAHLWIETAGPNTFFADFALSDNKFTKFNIMQTASDKYPTLRPHQVKIGFYNFTDEGQAIESSSFDQNVTATGSLSLKGAKLKLTKQIEVSVEGEMVTPVDELIGLARPDFLLLNDEGSTFGKFRLDPVSEEVALRYPHKISDPLARCVAMDALWFAAHDAQIAPTKLIDAIFKLLPAETESITMSEYIRKLRTLAFTMVRPDDNTQIIKGVGSRLWDLTKDAVPGSDGQYQFFMGSFTDFASTGDHIAVLKSLLNGDLQLKGLELDNKIKWEIRGALARLGEIDKQQILIARQEDKSEHGRMGAAFTLASLNTFEAKKVAVESVYSKFSELSNSEILETARGFNNVFDTDLIADFMYEYYDRATEIWESKDFAIAEAILRSFYPARIASLELAQLGERWLENNEDQPAALRRIMIENLDGTRNALKAQKVTL